MLRKKERNELIVYATQCMHYKKKKTVLSEIRLIKRVHSVCFHLYETPEDRNLIYGDKKAIP